MFIMYKNISATILFIFITIIFIFQSAKTYGQALPQKCATEMYMQQLYAKNPQLKKSLIDAENNETNIQRTQAIITIPVVVHVLHRGEPIGTNTHITPQQIESQITILNNDFRAQNDDITNVPIVFQSKIGDTKIQFCLATLDPDSNPTSGIVYKQTIQPYFSLDNNVKFDTSGGSNAWPADKYLNIWVCDLRNFNGDNLLGFAQFPNGPAETDGIVVRYEAFGNVGNVSLPYNKGRTATHEVGHWLNLIHIWGDNVCGNDLVSDTPTQEQANFGNVVNGAYLCPGFPHVTCNNGPDGDMYMNYMDYTFDKCMHMFTKGQSNRMNKAIVDYRASFLTTKDLCVPPNISPDTNVVNFELVSNNTLLNSINILVIGNLSTDVEVAVYNTLGQSVLSATYAKSETATAMKIDLPNLKTGFYYISIFANSKQSKLKFYKLQ